MGFFTSTKKPTITTLQNYENTMEFQVWEYKINSDESNFFSNFDPCSPIEVASKVE